MLRGFTFPEVLVTISLMLVLLVLAGGLAFQGQSVATRLGRANGEIQERLLLSTVLATLCQEVLPPEWAGQDQVFHTSAQNLTVGYFDGRADQSLILAASDGVLRVESPRGVYVWRSLASVKLEYWKRGDRIVGLTVLWNEASHSRTLNLSWGARPL